MNRKALFDEYSVFEKQLENESPFACLGIQMYACRVRTWNKDGKVTSPPSTHKVVPFNNFRRATTEALVRKNKESSSP